MKRKRRKPKPDPGLPLSTETPTAEYSTVAWMLATMSALGCLVGHIIVQWIAKTAELPKTIETLAALLFFAALVSGVLSLLLAGLVHLLRKQSPPWPVTAGAIIIALMPLAILLSRT